jgi:pimeloyl-ACP methyl ester carboxylesterase
MKAGPVVFVHGLFTTPRIWEDWLPWFAERGFRGVAPAWPGCEWPPAELRAGQDPALARVTFSDLVAQFGAAAEALGTQTVIIGHGIGGLVAQVLVNRGAVAAGVALHSASPRATFPYSRRAWRLFGRGASPSSLALSFEDFAALVGNALPPELQAAMFDRYIAPGAPQVAHDARNAGAAIDFVKAHPPLLMTTGVLDRAVPPRLAFDDFSRYRQRGAITDFRAFDGRGHMAIVEPGWEEIADVVIHWLDALQRWSPPRPLGA